MAYFNKIGLLITNKTQTEFLVCEKNNFTTDFILPGGKIEKDENDIKCLQRELKEELQVDIDLQSIKYINKYIDIAAGDPTKDVEIIGLPQPSQEIIGIQWLNKNDLFHPRLSPIIKNKILPDLIEKNIIK